MTQYAQFQSHNNVGIAKISVANLMLEEISFSAAPVVSGVSGGARVRWSVVSSHSRHLAPGGASDSDFRSGPGQVVESRKIQAAHF